MANVQLNVFETIPHLGVARTVSMEGFAQVLSMQVIRVPGSVSMQKMALIYTGSNTAIGGASSTFSVGLYSKDDTNFSLANSASKSFSLSLNETISSWIVFSGGSISNTSFNITPGNWWLGFVFNTGGFESGAIIAAANNGSNFSAYYTGLPFAGTYATAGLPITIGTNDVDNHYGSDFGGDPAYIIIGT